MKTKTFACVEMKRRGAELVQKQLEGKSLAQRLEYWQKGTCELKKLQKQKKGKNWQQTVDLVTADTVKPRLKPAIDKEVIYAKGL